MNGQTRQTHFQMRSLLFKVILPQFLIFCLVLGSFIYLAVSIQQRKEAATLVFDKVQKASLLTSQIRKFVSDKKKYLLSYRFDPKPIYLRLLRNADKEILSCIEQMKILNPSRRGQRVFEAYLESRKGIVDLQEALVNAIDEGSEKRIARVFNVWINKKQINEAAIADLNIFNVKKLHRAGVDLEAADQRFRRVMTGLTLALLLLAIVSGVSTYRTLILPLWEMRRVADAIAGGNLDARVASLKGTDEIEKLTIAINHMVGSLSETQKQLEMNAQQLSRSNKELEQFAGVAAHDLRSPLRSIVSWAQMLDRLVPKPRNEEIDQAIGFIEENGKKANALVNDILELAKVNVSATHVRHIELDQVVQGILSNLKQDVEIAHAHIHCGKLPAVQGVSSLWESLFTNLIRNALTYRDKSREPEIDIGFNEQADCYEFSVKDNGIGIEPQHTDRIFEMFNRLHSNEEYPGTGIGLALCKKIVELFGGRIWVDSVPGTGSTFYFRCPKSIGGKAA